MGRVLHGSATTTEAVRRAIQAREESVRALARRYGVSPTTVQKWRKRGMDFPPESGGMGSERHAAASMVTPSMPARASTGVR